MNRLTSTTPSSWPLPLTTGNASSRRVAKYSLAISTVAQSGIATTWSSHHVADQLLGLGGQQAARRHHANQLFVVIDDIEVVNAGGVAEAADAIERFGDGLIGLQHEQRRPRERKDRLVQLRCREGGDGRPTMVELDGLKEEIGQQILLF